MAEISATKLREDAAGFGFEVVVDEQGSRTVHQVMLSRSDHRELSRPGEPPERFVRRCFEWLLDREPKEAILSRFDVRDIGRYFPEFREDIRR